MATSAAITQVLNRLRSELGLGETPPNSNDNKIVQWYNKNVYKIGRGPWCEMTITWAMWTGGAKVLKRGRAYTVFAVQDGLDQINGSTWHFGTKGMRAGDQVYYDWNGGKNKTHIVDHTGMVEKVNGNGTFYVLEGNTNNNRLERKLRDGKYVVGYVRFNWPALAKAKPPATKPKPVITNPKPTPTPSSDAPVRELQRLLGLTTNGKWDKTMDFRAGLMRRAATVRTYAGRRTFPVLVVQRIIGAKADGDFGPNSQRAMVSWVRKTQRVLDVDDDGVWGPRTDNAFIKTRSQFYMKH